MEVQQLVRLCLNSHSRSGVEIQPGWCHVATPGSLIMQLLDRWIGLRENFNRKTPYLMGKSMVSCRFSLKPIH